MENNFSRAKSWPKSSQFRVAVLVAMTAVTISVHYKGMHSSDLLVSSILRQFCYLPILLSALWFGTRGGLLNAGVIVLVVAPSLLTGHMGSVHLAHEGIEYFYYFLFGGVFGYLADRERHAQRKREELVRQVARMEHLSAIGELAAGLAHEIKNPMGSIKGAAEILASELPATSPKHEFVEVLVEEVERLNRVVEDFLNFARPLELERKTIPLDPLLGQVAAQLGLQGRAGVEINTVVAPGLTVLADEKFLRQVLLNLGLNALDAMAGAGRLAIRAERQGPEVAIDFQDSGPGVPPDAWPKIFMPFYTTKHNGTGLGLTISERIVSAHGGRLEVLDAPGGGAIFRVTLPGDPA